MAKIGFIGMGNMGYAMLKGCLDSFGKDNILFTDVNKERCEQVGEETQVSFVNSNLECAMTCDYIIMAVKPQYYKGVIDEIKEGIKPEQIIISIAPGKTIADLKEAFGRETRIVRAMPNTPAMVLEGMSGVCMSDDEYSEEEKATVAQFFNSFGKMAFVDEKLLSAVTAASGSSPAFVYMFIEALADGAVRFGLPRDKAYEFAAQAVLGSAKMVLETKEHPGRLKDNVCSPGGTTIAGVAVLEEKGFRSAVIEAAKAVFDKCDNI